MKDPGNILNISPFYKSARIRSYSYYPMLFDLAGASAVLSKSVRA